MTTKVATINSRTIPLDMEPRQHLADFVRDGLQLTGTHVGCEQGICGACTVVRDGRPVRACLTWATSCEGSQIRTIEDFDDDEVMARLRTAFSAEHALQCGFCTPGMLITAQDIVRRFAGTDIDDQKIRYELSGNLCRCTGYVGIVRAIQNVLDQYQDTPAPRFQPPGPSETEFPDLERIPLATATSGSGQASIRSRADGNGRRIESRFTLPHSAETTWQVLRSELPAVVACLPGAELESLEEDGALEGFFNVSLGPVSARIAGEGTAHFDDQARTGEIEGRGSDSRSNSQASGRLSFEVSPLDGQHCEMTVAMSFQMTGTLAQFSRGGLVDEIVSVLIEQFQTNFNRHMSGESPLEQRSLGLVQLAWMAVRRWFRRLF